MGIVRMRNCENCGASGCSYSYPWCNQTCEVEYYGNKS